MNQQLKGYDIIGDIHGCADALKRLLAKLGYEHQEGCYRHPERKAVFLGDLIDRGPQVREAINIVRTMVENDAASMVLGNHEYMAIIFSTLKKHTSRYKRLLEQTLQEYQQREQEWDSVIRWMQSLPLYMEFDNFRVVHACWDAEKIADLDTLGTGNHLQNDSFLSKSAQPGTTENKIIERLLKGTDMLLPEGVFVKGADGVSRTRFRTKFWKSAPETYADVVFQPDRIPNQLLNKKLSVTEKSRLTYYAETEKPLFVGHYWRSGQPRLIRDNIVCLDYGAVNHGKLVAYRMECTDTKLLEDRLIWVSA
ncbi:MAG: serine/threonine protein phosphatase [Gammaproteobacteria bacterium]|nr:MAG: serine/threonine protein phosphatase [Gammaproteobacteria bacterium]